MTDCLDQFLWEKLPFFFADPVLLALFLVELRWLLALRARRAGTLAFYVWQYAATFVLYVVLYIISMMSAKTAVYIPGLTECLEAYERRYGWIFGLGLGIPVLGLTLTSYAACAVLEDGACRILMPVLVLRTIVAGGAVYAGIASLAPGISLWALLFIYFAMFALYFLIYALSR